MLLHVSPKLVNAGPDVALIDVLVMPYGLRLIGGVDVDARRPYPNKTYRVACRKVGRRAVHGLLLLTPEPLTRWSVVTRWAVDASVVLTHRVNYELLDSDFAAASDSMVLWYGTDDEWGGWSDRIPACHRGKGTMEVEPCMRVAPAVRHETLRLPTIEPERLLPSAPCDRLPRLADAFHLPAATPE